MGSRGGNNWDDGRWLVNRALHCVFYGCVRAAFIIVIAAFHRACHVLPIGGARPIPVDFILRMPPHTSGVTVHTVLDKSEEVSFLFV